MNGSHYEWFTEKVPGWDIWGGKKQLGEGSNEMTEMGYIQWFDSDMWLSKLRSPQKIFGILQQTLD